MYKLTEEKCKAVVDKMATMICDYCMSNNLHNLVIGMSGGMDSAFIGAISDLARTVAKSRNYVLHVVAVIMPCDSKPLDEELAIKLIKAFNLDMMKVDLSDVFHHALNDAANARGFSELTDPKIKSLLTELTHGFITSADEQIKNLLVERGEFRQDEWDRSAKVAQGNIKARLRMITLYHIARRLPGGMVMSTDNWSELMMAFWTLKGDEGDFAAIQMVMKGLELYDLARTFENFPSEIMERLPTDGLGVNEGGDAAQIGAKYPIVDPIMIRLIQNGFDTMSSTENDSLLANMPNIPEADLETSLKVAIRANNGAYKRRGTFIITRKDLGLPEIEDIKLD